MTPVNDIPLTPYAQLPAAYRDRHIAHSTVDAFGRAHWLLTAEAHPWDGPPYEAVVVTVGDGHPYETHLSAVRPHGVRFDALADGGFIVAATRSHRDEEPPQAQVFDALGRPSWTFRLGDAIEHLLADEDGTLWVGYFDEGIFGDDLSAPGLRQWSGTGDPLWEFKRGPGVEDIADCYALNVGAHSVWVCPYQRFPLIEVRDGRTARIWDNPVRGASGFAVCGDRVVFYDPSGDDRHQLVDCRLGESAVRPVTRTRLVRPDGGALRGRRRVVCRGPRIYVQVKPFTAWTLLDITADS
ncbi:hypothetical protein ACFVT5_33180 [Streptomyces sp. NPDC058001]|uniref:hypothetical protein n=1 Tax=Streptomyces sp. NPDC058001 TaxID=3346300 RepID=UPI0036EB2650